MVVLRWQCGQCGLKCKAPLDTIGWPARCPRCGGLQEVPSLQALMPEEVPRDDSGLYFEAPTRSTPDHSGPSDDRTLPELKRGVLLVLLLALGACLVFGAMWLF